MQQHTNHADTDHRSPKEMENKLFRSTDMKGQTQSKTKSLRRILRERVQTAETKLRGKKQLKAIMRSQFALRAEDSSLTVMQDSAYPSKLSVLSNSNLSSHFNFSTLESISDLCHFSPPSSALNNLLQAAKRVGIEAPLNSSKCCLQRGSF